MNLSPEDYEKFAYAVGIRLTEYFDGFAVVGFHPVTKEPVVFTHAEDKKTRHALNDLLKSAIAPISCQNDPDSDGKTA